MRRRTQQFWIALTMAALLAAPATARAENEGQAELDKATAAKLAATGLKDLETVIGHLEKALELGLDDDNRKFAEQLLAGTLMQRATVLVQAIFSPDGPDPRWPQMRGVALADLQRTIELDPEQYEAHMAIGRLNALPGGDRERAIKALTAVADAKEAEKEMRSRALTMRGGLQTEGDAQLADFDAALELVPDRIETIRARGMHHLLKRDVPKAVADLQQAIKLEPEHAGTHEAIGLARMIDGKLEAARKHFDKAIELEPENGSFYANRARVFGGQEKYKKALADLGKAIELAPENLQLLLLRAQVHQEREDSKSALADVDEAIRLRAGWLPALRLRAQILAGEGKMDEAIAGLERLKQQRPTNRELTVQLGLYYLANKQAERAVEMFDLLLADTPDNPVLLRQRGDAYLGMGKQAAAVADYASAVKLLPDDSGLLNNLAWVLATSPDDKLRDGKRSIKLATEACELTEFKQAHILSTLAAAYAESGNFEKAIEWSAKAVEIGDEDQQEQLEAELASYKEEKPWRELQENDAPETAEAEPDPAPAATIDF